MSIFSIRVTNSFDGTTPITSTNVTLTKTKTEAASEIWAITDGSNAEFADVGIVPLSVLSAQMPERASYVQLAVRALGTANDLTITPMLDLGGGTFVQCGVPVTANPDDGDEPPAGNVLLAGYDYALKIETNTTEAQQVVFDLVPVSARDLANIGQTANTPANGGGGKGLTFRPSVATTANIVQGTIQPYDATGGAFGLSAPNGAKDRRFGVLNTNASVNAVTVTPAGADTIENLSGAQAASCSVNIAFGYREWQFDDEIGGWRIVGAKN